jgi:hypothetical protein
MAKKLFGASLFVAIALIAAIPVLAATDVNVVGEVTAVDTVAGNFTLQSGVDVYSVIPPAGFDLASLAVGAQVVVAGSLDAGVITATSVEVMAELGVVGQVTAVGADNFELQSFEGVAYSVTPPDGFDLSTLTVGTWVFVHGDASSSLIVADTVEILAEVDLTGQITAVDTVAGNFTLLLSDGTSLTVLPPAGFDLATLTVGNFVMVHGAVFEGTLYATNVALVPQKGALPPKDAVFCTNTSRQHPALSNLAATYDAPYAELLNFFCIGRFGVGEIKLALQASAALDGEMTAGEILALKVQLGGWGQVWKQIGVKP